jgi:hypothetical protein
VLKKPFRNKRFLVVKAEVNPDLKYLLPIAIRQLADKLLMADGIASASSRREYPPVGGQGSLPYLF